MKTSIIAKADAVTRRLYAVGMIAAVALAAQPALAQVSGGVDPETALSNLQTYGFGAAGAAISLICLFKGSHAVAEGRHLLPFIGGALGGIVLAFGGPYLLQIGRAHV